MEKKRFPYVVNMPIIIFAYVLCGSVLTSATVLHVSNNGPAVFGSKITFTARLEVDHELENEYTYIFEDDYDDQHRKEVQAGLNAAVTIEYPEVRFSRNDYEMNVKVYVWHTIFQARLIAQGSSKFQLTNRIPGEIVIFNNSVPADDQQYVPTFNNINITFVIHDPENYFKNAIFGYLWKIGEDMMTSNTSVIYNFTKASDNYMIALTVYATFPEQVNGTSASRSMKTYYGMFGKILHAKDEIKIINVTGNSWLPHRDLLNFEINCTGSGPFNYCNKVFYSNETVENITCDSDDPVYSNKCYFTLIHYFPDPGDYTVAIAIKNDVSHNQKNILVHSYDISHKTQLSVIIIPIVCSILAFVIIVVGIAWHIHNRKQYMVEVADFDFVSSDILIERTFFERLRDTLMLAWWKNGRERLIESDAEKREVGDYIDENYVPV